MVVITEHGDTGLVTEVDEHQVPASVRFHEGSGTPDGWYPVAELNEALDQTWIEYRDRPCPVCGAQPDEPCTMPRDRRREPQPRGRSHPERGGFDHAHEARSPAAAESGS